MWVCRMTENPSLEFELKFTCSDPVRKRLLSSAWLKEYTSAPGKKKRNLSTYYDTADRRLMRKGVVLRVRQKGRQFEQTVKAAGEDGSPLARFEWTMPLPSAYPDAAAFGPPELRARIGLILPAELEPTYVTDIDRVAVPLKLVHDGRETVVEAAFDGGKVSAGKAATALSEVELEHVSGDPLGVYRLGLSLLEAAPVSLETRTKSHRGRALRYGEPCPAVYASPAPMARGDTVTDVFSRVGQNCLNLILANQGAILDRQDIEGVHQMRVGLRRMKSLLAIFGKLLPERELARLKRQVDWLNDELGTARDLDVLLFETLEQVRAGRPDDTDLAELEKVAGREREKSYDRICRLLAGKRFARFVLTLALYFAEQPWLRMRGGASAEAWHQPISALAEPFLDKRRKAVNRRGRGFARLDTPARHDVRISLKKLRYAVDFFAPLYASGKVKPYLKRLKELQNDLGALNDVAVAEIVLAGLNAPYAGKPVHAALESARGQVIGWFGHRVASGEDELVAAWKGFEQAVPFWKTGA